MDLVCWEPWEPDWERPPGSSWTPGQLPICWRNYRSHHNGHHYHIDHHHHHVYHQGEAGNPGDTTVLQSPFAKQTFSSCLQFYYNIYVRLSSSSLSLQQCSIHMIFKHQHKFLSSLKYLIVAQWGPWGFNFAKIFNCSTEDICLSTAWVWAHWRYLIVAQHGCELTKIFNRSTTGV